jgi:isopentenyl phosphate kinase
VILAVDPDRFADVVEAARRAGLTVTGEQPILGTLSGTIAEDRILALTEVAGVVAVDRDRTIHLPPPDSPIQ